MEKPYPLADWMLRQIHVKKVGLNVLITGPTQYRKSTTAISLAHQLNRNFSLDNDCAIIEPQSIERLLADEAMARGEVKLLDEIGAGVYRRHWYKRSSINIIKIVETFGREGKIILATVPYGDLVDKDLYKFFNVWIDILNKVEPKKYVIARVMLLEYNSKGEFFKKYPKKKQGGAMLRQVRIPWREVEENGLLAEYFRRSDEAKKRMKMEMVQETADLNIKDMRTMFSAQRCADEVCEKSKEFTRINQASMPYISIDLVKTHFNIGGTRAKTVKVLAESKLGYGMAVRMDQNAQVS